MEMRWVEETAIWESSWQLMLRWDLIVVVTRIICLFTFRESSSAELAS